MKDSCLSTSGLLEKYFDREVTGEERSIVERHLPHCLSCRESLKSMEGLLKAIKGPVDEALREETYPWVWEKIEKEIRSEQKSPWWQTFRSWPNPFPLTRKRVWVPALVVAMLLLITIPSLLQKNASIPNPTVVKYVESESFNVMVYESEKAKITVIWLFSDPEKESSTS